MGKKVEKNLVDIIIEIAKDFGNICRGYSGRGMYGKTCIGITTDDPDGCIEEAASRGIRGACTDQMGKQFIVYWPNIEG